MNYDRTLEIPPEVIEAANTLSNWAQKNDLGDYWEIAGVCSRHFAMAPRTRTPEQQRQDRIRGWAELAERWQDIPLSPPSAF